MASLVPGGAVQLASRGSRVVSTAVRVCLGVRGWCTPAVQPDGAGQPDYDYHSCTAKQYRWHKNLVLRQNRLDPHLEAKARLKKLHVPLDEVRCDWLAARGRGMFQLQTSGTHCSIYRDVFGHEFRPEGFLSVSYSDSYPVNWGNLIQARHALEAPRVILQSQRLSDGYASLILTNPDGHLLDNTQELLHWMVVNIPVRGGHGSMEEGSTLVPYLPPVPPQGTGFHRYVFSLYTHATPLSQDPATPFSPDPATPSGAPEAGEWWLEQRRFSSGEFLSAREGSGLKPWSFAFFQSQWDKSVSHTYKHTLKSAEPCYGPERKLGPRKLRQKAIYSARQAKYTNL